MIIKGLVDEDFVNYKKPSMYIIMPYCSFKCDKENGISLCQNSRLVNEPNITIENHRIIERYAENSITQAVVFAGLEPFDSSSELESFIKEFRAQYMDDIVIYTGYTEYEIAQQFDWIYNYTNIIIKYGRFIPNQKGHIDPILGVTLASNNQYARHINAI